MESHACKLVIFLLAIKGILGQKECNVGTTSISGSGILGDLGDRSAGQTENYGVLVIKKILIRVCLTVVPVGSMYTLCIYFPSS